MDEQESKVSFDLIAEGSPAAQDMIEGSTITTLLNYGAEGIFYVVTLVFLGFSLAFVYHWWSYAINKTYTLIMLAIYLGVSAVLFIGMMLSLTAL